MQIRAGRANEAVRKPFQITAEFVFLAVSIFYIFSSIDKVLVKRLAERLQKDLDRQ